MHNDLINWAGNIRFSAARIHRPSSLPELQAIVRGSPRVRALGSGHSFSPIADTTGDLVSLHALPPRVDVAEDRATATVGAGLRYGEVASRLHGQGLALHNLGSLPHISVAGAIATGTHGSGTRCGSLASAVTTLEMVTSDGELLRLSRSTDADRFTGAVVALGCLGIVTAVTLEVQPTYDVLQLVYEDLPSTRLRSDLDEILAAGYSVSLFTTWDTERVDQVWVKRRVDARQAGLDPRWMDARAATKRLHPIRAIPADSCTEQLGVAGPWHERLPHFRLDHTPSSGTELQTEYLVPRSRAVDAIAAVEAIGALMSAVLQISEIRAVAADDLWLSPAYGRDSLALHFTWTDDVASVMPVVAVLDEALAPLDARPHWGKVFSTPVSRVRRLYPRMPDFRALRHELDPTDAFGNEMVDTYIGTT